MIGKVLTGAAMAAAMALWPTLSAAQSAASKPGAVFRDCVECPEMLVVPSGSALIGSSLDEGRREGVREKAQDKEQPSHSVTIARPFAVGRFEVTKAEYAAFARATDRADGDGCYILLSIGKWEKGAARSWRDPGFTQGDREPAACVNWDDAKAYAAWLSSLTGKGYRLLSESEWEYAARASTTTARYWGDSRDDMCAHANVSDLTRADTQTQLRREADHMLPCRDGFVHLAPVGSFPANGFGLFDMIGNVWEWTQDCANSNYQGAPTDGSAWLTGNCSLRVVRGGSWDDRPSYLRAAQRVWYPAAESGDVLGFRVARTLH